MTLPSSGPLTLADIQTEFGGSNPISLSEYYAGGAYVPSGTSGTYGAVPSSGTISIRNFYGTTKSRIMTAATVTIPGKASIYEAGYSDGVVQATAFGSMTLASYGGATIKGLWWESTTSPTTVGQVYIAFSGNQSAGFFSSVTSNGTSLGAVGTRFYNSSGNYTYWALGANNVNVPFANGSNYTIVIT